MHCEAAGQPPFYLCNAERTGCAGKHRRPLKCKHFVDGHPGHLLVFEENVELKVTQRRRDTRDILAHGVTWKNHRKLPREGGTGAIYRLDGCRDSND